METGAIVLLAYAAVMLLGGLMGYSKAGSRPSLVAGLVSAALLFVAFWIGRDDPGRGYGLGTIIALLLTAVFAVRFMKTRKAMPSGMLFAVSLAALLLLGSAWRGLL